MSDIVERLRNLAKKESGMPYRYADLMEAADEIERLRKLVGKEKHVPVAIQRLIDEVKVDKEEPFGGYNRTYHRHNR